MNVRLGESGATCGPLPNAVATCKAGACAISMCNGGFADCDMKVVNGCEVTLATDVNNCGTCGIACQPGKNQAATCAAGKCGLGACLQGFADCNANLNDGCEATVASDPKNCGACGVVCPMNKASCSNGVCVVGLDFGPTHSFTGLSGTHYITQGGCGVNNSQNIDDNATYFCLHFYGQPLGMNCTPVSGYKVDRLVNCVDVKLHKNGGCTGNGNNIMNTTCDAGPCKIGNWNECTSGIANIVCHCQ